LATFAVFGVGFVIRPVGSIPTGLVRRNMGVTAAIHAVLYARDQTRTVPGWVKSEPNDCRRQPDQALHLGQPPSGDALLGWGQARLALEAGLSPARSRISSAA
jgi:hypothetical protein